MKFAEKYKKMAWTVLCFCGYFLLCGCDGSSEPSTNSYRREYGIRNLTKYSYIKVDNYNAIINKGETKYFFQPSPNPDKIFCRAGGKEAKMLIYSRQDKKFYSHFNPKIYKESSGIVLTSLFEKGMVLNLIEQDDILYLTNIDETFQP
ncbi:MAG: hypothetical protein E7044_06600 [Lentisphaerae bacterium]|nr:hypothetical protein [Lentisphaerota bacterium]